MKQKSTRVHQSEEQNLLALLSAKAFSEIGSRLSKTKDTENFAVINFCTCPECGAGCVDLTSMQTRTVLDKNNTAKKETRQKRILSMMISAEEAKSLAAQLQPA